jgi:uncharacterized protein YqgV (UPF0045/DUF77 family)
VIVQAEISLYPLGESEYGMRIESFIEKLEESGLDLESGKMSTIISGECGDVFRVLSDAYEADIATGASVMTIKVSNACPVE